MARTEGSAAATICAVCGGPRIPNGFGGAPAVAALKEQKKLLDDSRLASFTTVVFGFIATIGTLLGLAIMPAALAAKLLIVAVAVLPLVLAFRARGKASALRTKAKEANERAWQAAAEDVAGRAKTDGITASRLAEVLQIDATRADQLLTSLTVHDRTRIDVGDDAEVRYSAVPSETVRVHDGEHRADEADHDVESDASRTEREPAR